ncbi:hypothetical protein B0A55_10902 [Friedmanniomyces simplex]|uniref:Uncharacterized protein n=1 Tax=Friedmanniomyces simplex TaxID=329884 RepID=A0A4U0WFE1_9PEZI|nr:hypothetical protein B0A55_10902 [Friedmanniomyces simplex]
MKPTTVISALTLSIALGNGSPVAEPAITPFPNLVPTSPVDLATDNGGDQTISPLRVPAHAVTLARRDGLLTVDNIVYSTGFPDLVPTSTIDLATDSTFTTQDVSPTRELFYSSSTPSALDTASTASQAAYATSVSVDSTLSSGSSSKASTTAFPMTVDGAVYPTGYPDLVPSTTVDVATDSTFTTQNVSPTRVAAATATAVAYGYSSDAKKVTSGASGLRPPVRELLEIVCRLRR